MTMSCRQLLPFAMCAAIGVFDPMHADEGPSRVESFEEAVIGSHPVGWNDLASVAGNGESDSVRVVRGVGAFGEEGQVLEMVSSPATTRGLYRVVGESQGIMCVSADVLVEQDMERCFDAFLLELGVAEFQEGVDPFGWKISSMIIGGVDRLFTSAYSGPAPGEGQFRGDIGSPEFRRWYRVSLAADTVRGSVEISLRDVELDLLVSSQVLDFPFIVGRSYDTVFLATHQRGVCAPERNGSLLIDNVRYPDPACVSVARSFQSVAGGDVACGDFSPGGEVEITLEVVGARCDVRGALVIEESVPAGWNVSSVEHSPVVKNGTLRWTIPSAEVFDGFSVRYTVVAPLEGPSAVDWGAGTVSDDASIGAIEGRSQILADAAFDECGGIRCWNVLGPFLVGRKLAAEPGTLRTDFLRSDVDHELEFVFEPGRSANPAFRGAVRDPSSGEMVMTHAVERDGIVTLGDRPWFSRSRAVAYAQAYLYSEDEREVYLHVSHDDAMQVFVNEREVYYEEAPVFGDSCTSGGISEPVILRSGENRILVKTLDRGEQWNFSVSLRDDRGDPAIEGLRTARRVEEGCRVAPAVVERVIVADETARLGSRVVPVWSTRSQRYDVSLVVTQARLEDRTCSTAKKFVLRERIPSGWEVVAAGGGTQEDGDIVWMIDPAEFSSERPYVLTYTLRAPTLGSDAHFVGIIDVPEAPFSFYVDGDREAIFLESPFRSWKESVLFESDFDEFEIGECPDGWMCNRRGDQVPEPQVVRDVEGARLRMTREEPFQSVSLFYDDQIDLNGEAFGVEFDLLIRQDGLTPSADGLCFVVLDADRHDASALGGGGGDIGYGGLSGSFAVEFDTWDNDGEGPLDPSGFGFAGPAKNKFGHAGVLRDGDTDVHVQTQLDLDPARCPVSLDREMCSGWPVMVDVGGGGIPLHVELEYNRGRLRVWLSAPPTDGGGEPEFERQIVLDTIVRLREKPRSENEGVQALLGFSSATGGLGTVHEIDNLVITRFSPTDQGSEFQRGDANDDGAIDISDASHVLNFLFGRGSEPRCFAAADVNDDSRVDISDAIFALSHLFLGGDPPPRPYPGCGTDPTPDTLGCASTALCP